MYGRGHVTGLKHERRPRQPRTPAQTAARIVASIRARQAAKRPWRVEEYTQRSETVALVRELLEEEVGQGRLGI